MLTLFTTAKPFRGHTAIIQRNALQSWTRLHPDVEVILFGDDGGAAEVARELGIRHEPHVERSEFGSTRLDYMMGTARAIARHDVLCYINCDMILMQDFRRAIEQVRAAHSQFLMVGRRRNVNITQPWDFSRPNWETRLHGVALLNGVVQPPESIDYFVFSRDLYGTTVPPFVVGRAHFDNWLVWRALDLKQPVVDVSAVVMAIHQNHDYRHHPQGFSGTLYDEEALRNLRLAGGHGHLRNIDCAPVRLSDRGLAANPWHWLAWSVKRPVARGSVVAWTFLQSRFWHPLLDLTRPLRHAMGLRREAFHRRSRESA